jgi:hypothetical protein
MRNGILLAVAFLCSISTHKASAQACRDSTLPYANINVNPLNYQPVCGCNGKTYRNSQYMLRDGVQYTAPNTSGPCEPMDFFFYPTLVSNADDGLKLYIALQASGDVQIYIIDYFAHQYYYRTISYIDYQVPPQVYPISVDNLNTGVYFLVVKTGAGYFKIKRFEKQNI